MDKFLMKYEMKEMLIENRANRPGTKRKKTIFAVAHDTGNINSTAENNAKYMNRTMKVVGGKNMEPDGRPFRVASAHVFIDDKDIVITVPIDEIAWHVRYDVDGDNKLFGDDANDASVGVELCFFQDVNRSKEAYKKYVWFFAYLCHIYKWKEPKEKIGFHSVLDPVRKKDPKTAFDRIGVTYESFLDDVKKELAACSKVIATRKPKKTKGSISVEDANDLIRLCKREWAGAEEAEEKKQWNKLANLLRTMSGQKEE